jgi:hypothetical protein
MVEPAQEALSERSSAAVRSVLERVFGTVDPGLRYRLWDGSEGDIGHPDGSFVLEIRDRDTFRRCFSAKNTKIMAESFVDRGLDVDGDLFAALRVANQLEDVELGWVDKLAIYLDLMSV